MSYLAQMIHAQEHMARLEEQLKAQGFERAGDGALWDTWTHPTMGTESFTQAELEQIMTTSLGERDAEPQGS